MKKFITLEESIEILNKEVKKLDKEKISLIDSVKRIIAEDVKSEINNPPFNKSAMDGYAIIAQDTKKATLENKISFNVIDKVYAGEVCSSSLCENEAIKIMTGAPIPKGANAVIKQEEVEIEGNTIKISCNVKENQNVCFKGEDISKGKVLVKKGKRLDYADIGILASAGVNEITVYKKPKIALLSTGDEVIDIGEILKPGKIYNSNKYSLMARLKELGYEVEIMEHIEDTKESIAREIKEVANKVDLIITTGGASVGEKDLLISAIDLIEGEKLFWKITIKPGSAVLCSKVKDSIVISLSGNPTAALTTFELLAKTTLDKLSGNDLIQIKREKAVLIDELNKKSPQRRFIRGNYYSTEEGQFVSITQTKSGNGILSSALNSNCLIEVEKGCEGLNKGSIVDIIKL
ncbi:molybdopterin molybdotransferase MoeA [Clostridium sp.]|uniref:molybdopterin molybdotransferase MoeA n=1 Tax=Clostridium sp. TaxID=1506 RepID=UPI003F3EAA92